MSSTALHRLGGLLLILIAAGAAWFAIYQPLQSARAGTGTVQWMPKATILVSMSLVYGVFFLITGDRCPYRNVEKQNFTPIGWVVFLIAAALAGYGYYVVDSALRGLGYHH